jgi:hypothetical protein
LLSSLLSVLASTGSHPAELRRQRSLSLRLLLKLNAVLHLSELSDHLDVTLESSKDSQTGSHLGRDDPKR